MRAPKMRSSALSWRVSVGAAVLLLAAAAGAQEQRSGFTAAERDSIRRGELVTRPHVVTASEPWLGGVSFQVIDRTIDEVWRALADLPAYRYMLPGTEMTRDDGVERGERLLFVRQAQMGVEARYWLRLRADLPSRRVQFDLDRERPHDVQSAHGFLELRTYQRSRTLVTWGLRATLGMGAVEPMVRGMLEPWLLRVPSTMKDYLEGWGRDLYVEEE